MKKFITCIFTTLILIFMCSCSFPKEKRSYTVELITKSVNSDFWKSVYNGASAFAAKNNMTIKFVGPKEEKDYREQVCFIENAIQNKPDAIILASGDYDLMAAPMEKAVENSIPVILIDSSVNSDKWVSFISTDNYLAGKTLAKEMTKRMPQNKKIGVISFVKNSSPSIEREKGFQNFLNSSSSTLKVINKVYCDSNIDTAERLTIEMLKSYPDICGIAGLNAQSATGAARALKKLNRNDIFLAGIDCTMEEAEYMDKGILKTAVLQNPYMMGYYSMETCFKVLNDSAYERNVYIDVSVVDKSNMFEKENQQLIFPFY